MVISQKSSVAENQLYVHLLWAVIKKRCDNCSFYNLFPEIVNYEMTRCKLLTLECGYVLKFKQLCNNSLFLIKAKCSLGK